MSKPVQAVPDGYHTVTPYLVVTDADAILSFVERAFGAEVLHSFRAPDGTVAHAEFRIGDSRVMVGQANEQWPALSAMLHLYVDDVDALYRRALEAGGRSIREPEDMFYGDRSGGVADPSGNQWWIATHVEDVEPAEMARRQAEQAEAGG